MSPEQCSGEPMDGRSDLYSLGVILFECVTGRLPFIDENPLRVMMMQVSSPMPDVRMFARTPLSDGFVDVLTKVMAKNPLERFADAREMRGMLEAIRPTAVEHAKSFQAAVGAPTAQARRLRSDEIASQGTTTGAGPTVRTGDPGPRTSAQAAAPTQARKTASTSEIGQLFKSRELRIAALGAAAVLVLLAIFLGGYLLASHQPTPATAKPKAPDVATEVAEEALEPVAAPTQTARFTASDDGKTVRDNKARLTWQRDIPANAQTAAQAGHYCNSLNLGGHGWRLPTKDELLGLAANIAEAPFTNAPTAWFWSDSPFQGSATNAWGVDFENGRAGPYDVTAAGRVRCVR